MYLVVALVAPGFALVVALAVHKHDDVYLVVALVAPVVALVVALAVDKHEHLCLALTGRFARKVGLGGKNRPSSFPFDKVLATVTMAILNS